MGMIEAMAWAAAGFALGIIVDVVREVRAIRRRLREEVCC